MAVGFQRSTASESSCSERGFDLTSAAHAGSMPRRPQEPSPVHELIPPSPTLSALRRAAATCQGCDLYRDATQTVFGEGAPDAVVMLVGEVPGDQEDRQGRPFVGPAGRLLNQALADADINREQVYLTNTVKHFRFERRGKVRLHKKPNAEQVHACFPWLEAELAVVRPRVLVLLGATAAQALLGSSFRVSRQRGELLESELAPRVLATVHPSSILRAPDDQARALAYKGFVADLAVVAEELGRRT
jgi:uracil-DNA glycosylase family protein